MHPTPTTTNEINLICVSTNSICYATILMLVLEFLTAPIHAILLHCVEALLKSRVCACACLTKYFKEFPHMSKSFRIYSTT